MNEPASRYWDVDECRWTTVAAASAGAASTSGQTSAVPMPRDPADAGTPAPQPA